MPNVESNGYTIGFAIVIVVGVALMLSGFSVLLKDKQKANEILDKKYQILGAIDRSVTKDKAAEIFDQKVTSYILTGNGVATEVPKSSTKAMDLEIRKELKKSKEDIQVPLYTYKDDDGSQKYILTLHGSGLWDYISGYMALNNDFNTVYGVKFDHVGETPGLGAEITKDWFQNNFVREELFDENGNFVGIEVLKGKGNKANAELHKVDGMSGATITGDGVEEMINVSVKNYLPYFEKQKGA